MKKFISLLTAFVMSFTVFISAAPAGAAETQTAGQTAIANDVSVKGTNSFGNLLSDEIMQKSNEQQENNGCNIFSAEVNETEAKISFETVMDGTLIVAVYDEAGTQMLASGSKEVTAGETEQTVTIDTENMPQYFYLRAFLVDSATLKPLCTQYESPNYTKEMQDFFAKTVNDFDSEKVLNLDDSESNNFAVFSDETKLIHSDDSVNNVTKADEENEQYAFENADDSLKSLKSGDTFACESENGEILIVKIADITVNGDKVTVTGEDTSMEEVFEYVKIDSSQGVGDAVVDASNLEEGVTYKGKIEDEAEPSLDRSQKSIYATDISGSKSMSLSFEIFEKRLAGDDDTNATVSGSLEFKMEASVKLYISFKKQYLEFKLSPSAEISVSITGTIKGKIKLAFMGFSPIPGVIIEVTPSFVVEASASLSLSGNLSADIGFSVRNGEGLKSLNSSPKFKSEVKVEGSIFIGFSIEPKVKIISDKIASVGLEGKIGALINASLIGGEKEPDKQHLCKKCIDGDISGVMSVSVNASLLKLKKLTWEYNIATKTIKLFDFYYSFETGKFGLKACPNWVYLVNLTVKDENGNAVSGAAVTDGNELNVKTDKNGEASFYLKKGEHNISAVKDNMSGSGKIKIIDESIKAEITMKPSEIEPTEPTESTEAAQTTEITEATDPIEIIESALGPVKEVSLGEEHSAAIAEDGSLYMWGNNYSGQLGNGESGEYENGDDKKSSTPIKIMDNVKAVCLGGYHSAAITEDGSLYMWGNNGAGQLGAGTTEGSSTPIKIMDNVKAVSLGWLHGAAIKEDGSLYMWGNNGNGQLGNGESGKDENGNSIISSTPIKIMDNVKAVSLGDLHSAAITEDGSLYMWGRNDDGELGNGESGYDENGNIIISSTPIKIMDNVKAVSLGDAHSAAITEDGSLYMWGSDCYSGFSDGTIEHYSSTPIKIMDNVKAVSLGGSHSAAITEDGSLYMWGNNGYGQLGDGTTENSYTPIKIMDNIKAIILGGFHSAAITEDGSLYMWGDNYGGQLGNGESGGKPYAFDEDIDSSTPIKINDTSKIIESVLGPVKEVSLGGNYSAAITEDGSLYIWGHNYAGQLGNGTTEGSSTPIKIMDNVKIVSLGFGHSAAITEDSSLYMWGDNRDGQLGNGESGEGENGNDIISPTPIKIMDNVKAVILGRGHSAAIKEDGSLYMWGDNYSGQLGNGTTENSSTPIKIMDNVKAVSLGGSHSAAITEDDSLYMWGGNFSGQLGNGESGRDENGKGIESLTPIKIMTNVKAVSLGEDYSVAITEDGSLYMWGYNCYGQLGNGTTEDSSTPIKIMDNVKAVSLEACNSAAITEDGFLYMWGHNYYGQLGNGESGEDENGNDIISSTPIKIMDNVKAVSLGGSHSAAITEDDSLYMWGENERGQLGNGESGYDENGNSIISSTPIKINDTSKSSSEKSVNSVNSFGLSALAQNISVMANETATEKTAEFTGLKANTIYNFYCVKSKDFESSKAEILDSDNLLFIGQYTSDENGNLKVSYIPREECGEYFEIAAEKFEFAVQSDFVLGDANGDGKLNVRDAAFIASALAKGNSDKLPEAADFNKDGKRNVRDAAAIASFLAKKR